MIRKEKDKERTREYYLSHRDKILAQKKEKARGNREKIRNYYEGQGEELSEMNKKYCRENRQKAGEYRKEI